MSNENQTSLHELVKNKDIDEIRQLLASNPRAVNQLDMVATYGHDDPEALEMYNEALRINEATYGHDHPAVASTIYNIAIVYNAQANYPKALEMYYDALRIYEATYGHDHPAVASIISCVADVYQAQGNYPKALEMYNDALRINETTHSHDHSDVASTINSIAIVYQAQGNYHKALEMYNDALRIYVATFGHDHPAVANTINNIADVYQVKGNYPKALELYNDALRFFEATYGHDHPDVASTINNIAIVYKAQGNYPKALEMYYDALRIYEATYGHDHPDVARTINNIAIVYKSQGNYPKALEMYNDALRIYEATYGQDHPDVASTINNIAMVYEFQGNYSKALESYNDALRIYEATYGHDHPDVASTINNIAIVYKSQGNYPKSLEMYNDALRIYEATYGHDHPAVASSINNIATVYKAQGNYPKALEIYNDALRIYEATYGHDHPDVARTINNIAIVYQAQGNYPKALEMYNNALPIYETTHGHDHPAVASTINNIANACQAQGNYPKALELYNDALRIYEATHGHDHPDVARTINNIAIVYKAQGNYPKALESYNDALGIYEATHGHDHPAVARTINNITSVYQAKDDYPEAVEMFNDAIRIKEATYGHDYQRADMVLPTHSLNSSNIESSEWKKTFEKACRVDERHWNRSRLYLVGSSRVGKTAVSRSIMSKSFINTESTIGIERFSCSVQYAAADGQGWTECDTPKDELANVLARTVYEDKLRNTVDKVNLSESTLWETIREDRGKLLSQHAAADGQHAAADIETLNRELANGSGSSANVNKLKNTSIESEMSYSLSVADDSVSSSPLEVDEAVVRKLCDSIETTSDLIISLFDFGGQSVFDVIHHLFFTPYGVYVVVFDMTRLCSGASDVDRDSSLLELKFWVNSMVIHTTDSKTEVPPPICFVGTHKDKLTDASEHLEISEIISRYLAGNPAMSSIIYNGDMIFFPVDNTLGRSDSTVVDLLKKVEDNMKESEYLKKGIPLKWFQALDKLMAVTSPYLELPDVYEIVRKCGVLESDYDNILTYFSKMGVLLWIDNEDLRDTVILDPIEYFVTPATLIICKHRESVENGESFKHEKKVHRTCQNIYPAEWDLLVSKGLLHDNLLEKLLTEHFKLTPKLKNMSGKTEDITKILMKFGLIVLTNPLEERKMYIAPAILQKNAEVMNAKYQCIFFPHKKKDHLINKVNRPTDLRSHGFMPFGLFQRFWGKLLAWYQEMTLWLNWEDLPLYNNYVELRIGYHHLKLYVSEELNAIQVEILSEKHRATLFNKLEMMLREVISEGFASLQLTVMYRCTHSNEDYFLPSHKVQKNRPIPIPGSPTIFIGMDSLRSQLGSLLAYRESVESHDVYLSYRTSGHIDKKLAIAIYDACLFKGSSAISVFRDHQWSQSVDESFNALVHSKVVVVIITPNTLQGMSSGEADRVLVEWIVALECRQQKGLRILPVKYAEVDDQMEGENFGTTIKTTISTATIRNVEKILNKLKLRISNDLANESVKDVVQEICDLPHLHEITGSGADWADLCRDKILDVLPVDVAKVEQKAVQPWFFCLICRTNAVANQGFKCRKCPSFVCNDCFPNKVKVQIDQKHFGNFTRMKGNVICTNPNCSNPLSEKELKVNCGEDLFDLYCEARQKVLVQLEVNKQLQIAQQKWSADNINEVERHSRHVIESILTLHCPCSAVFYDDSVDLDNCLALTCATCGYHFCGWCLTRCGIAAQAHEHVRECSVGKGLYSTKAEFESFHSNRRTTELRNYLLRMTDNEVKKQVVKRIATHLSESEKLALGIGSTAFNNEVVCNAFFYMNVSKLQYEVAEYNLVGKGSFGDVYYGQFGDQQRLCVVERLDYLNNISIEDAKRCYNEIEITELRKHANLQQLLGISLTEGLLVSMPYDTSLFNFLYVGSTAISVPLTLTLKLDLIRDIVCAIQYLHENDVVHGDIRPSNILLVSSPLDEHITAQVTGFGIPRSLRNLTTQDVPTFSLQYMSPELLEDYQISSLSFTPSSDIYSLGITINEIMTERIPWIGESRQDLIAAVKNGKRPPLFSYSARTDTEILVGELIGNVDKGCLSGNVSDRPSANSLLNQINSIKEIMIEAPSAIIDNQFSGELTGKVILDIFPIMRDSIGLYTYDSQTSADGSCHRLRGSELFLLAHYFRGSCDMSEDSYFFVVENMCQHASPDEVEVDTGYVINNTCKVMRDALGLYTLSLEADDEDRDRIYGNDLLLLARLYIDSDEMSARSYYFIRDCYSEVVSQLIRKQEKNKSENRIRATPNILDTKSKFAKFIGSKPFKYVTYGFFSTGQLRTGNELDVWDDRRNVKKYAEDNNSYDGSLLFEGNSGFKENIIGNLRDRYLPTAQSKKSDLVVYYGGHGQKGTGDWIIVENGSIVEPCPSNSQVFKITKNGHASITFEDFMSSVENFNSKFSPRVTVHIVLFSCYSGNWIDKLKKAREIDPGAYPDIGVILTAADKDHPTKGLWFEMALWGKEFGVDDANIKDALAYKPQKYISSVNPSVSDMTLEDFKSYWFKNGNDWKRMVPSLDVDALGSTGGISESRDIIDVSPASASELVNTSHVTNVSTSIKKEQKLSFKLMEALTTAWGFLQNTHMVSNESWNKLDSTFQLMKAEDLLDCDEDTINILTVLFSDTMQPVFKDFVYKAKKIRDNFFEISANNATLDETTLETFSYLVIGGVNDSNAAIVVPPIIDSVDFFPLDDTALETTGRIYDSNNSGPISFVNKCLNSAWVDLHKSTMIKEGRGAELGRTLERLQLDKAEDLLNCDEAAVNTLSSFFNAPFMGQKFKDSIHKAIRKHQNY